MLWKHPADFVCEVYWHFFLTAQIQEQGEWFNPHDADSSIKVVAVFGFVSLLGMDEYK